MAGEGVGERRRRHRIDLTDPADSAADLLAERTAGEARGLEYRRSAHVGCEDELGDRTKSSEPRVEGGLCRSADDLLGGGRRGDLVDLLHGALDLAHGLFPGVREALGDPPPEGDGLLLGEAPVVGRELLDGALCLRGVGGDRHLNATRQCALAGVDLIGNIVEPIGVCANVDSDLARFELIDAADGLVECSIE